MTSNYESDRHEPDIRKPGSDVVKPNTPTLPTFGTVWNDGWRSSILEADASREFRKPNRKFASVLVNANDIGLSIAVPVAEVQSLPVTVRMENRPHCFPLVTAVSAGIGRNIFVSEDAYFAIVSNPNIVVVAIASHVTPMCAVA